MQLWPVNNILMIFYLLTPNNGLQNWNFGAIFKNKKVRAIWNIEAVLEISKYRKLSGAISPASEVSERSSSGSGIFFHIPSCMQNFSKICDMPSLGGWPDDMSRVHIWHPPSPITPSRGSELWTCVKFSNWKYF